jgi:hypothetical protein
MTQLKGAGTERACRERQCGLSAALLDKYSITGSNRGGLARADIPRGCEKHWRARLLPKRCQMPAAHSVCVSQKVGKVLMGATCARALQLFSYAELLFQ